jgi:hypothetical protein
VSVFPKAGICVVVTQSGCEYYLDASEHDGISAAAFQRARQYDARTAYGSAVRIRADLVESIELVTEKDAYMKQALRNAWPGLDDEAPDYGPGAS